MQKNEASTGLYCNSCIHYSPHLVKVSGTIYAPTKYGHCSYPRARRRAGDKKACEFYYAKSNLESLQFLLNSDTLLKKAVKKGAEPLEKQQLPAMWETIINSAGALPLVVHSVQKVVDDRYHVEQASVHEDFELVYVQAAERAYFEICGEKVPVSTGDMLLIKPNTPHRLDVSGDHVCRFAVLKFCFMEKNVGGIADVSLEDFLTFVSSAKEGAYIRLQSRHRSEITSALSRIMAEEKDGDENSEFLCSLLILEIFVYLSRSLRSAWENRVNQKGEKMKEMMEAAKGFIEENFTQDIGLSDVASFVYLSSSHFARAFKRTYQVSPIQYLLSLRVEKAKSLLNDTECKIGEIALMVGFSAQQRFNDIFKKQTGLSPSDYRAQARQELLNQ